MNIEDVRSYCLSNQHLNSEQYCTNGIIVLAHFAEYLDALSPLQLSQELFIEHTAPALLPSTAYFVWHFITPYFPDQ